MSLPLEPPGWLPWTFRIHIWAVLNLSEETFLLGPPFVRILLIRFQAWSIQHHSFVLGSLYSQPRPKAQYTIWALNSTLAPQNSGFFPLVRREKCGFDFSCANIILPFDLHTWECRFAHVGVPFCTPHNCYWHFGTREVSLITPCSVMFPRSNGETLIQWLIFLLRFWAG